MLNIVNNDALYEENKITELESTNKKIQSPPIIPACLHAFYHDKKGYPLI